MQTSQLNSTSSNNLGNVTEALMWLVHLITTVSSQAVKIAHDILRILNVSTVVTVMSYILLVCHIYSP